MADCCLPCPPAPVWLCAGATCGRGMQDVIAMPAWPRCTSCANGSKFPIALREHSHAGTQGIRFCVVPRCPSCANGSRFPIALREHSHVGTQGIRFCLVPRGPFVVIISARRIADDGSTRIVVGAHNRSMYRRHKFGERRACVRAMRWQCCCTKYVGERRACVRPTWLGNAMAQYVQRPCRAKAVQRCAALNQLAAVVVARWCCLVA